MKHTTKTHVLDALSFGLPGIIVTSIAIYLAASGFDFNSVGITFAVGLSILGIYGRILYLRLK